MMFSSILSKRALVRASTASRSFSTTEKIWKVYLSGEIHSDWREVIAKGVSEKGLPVSITSPNTSHEDSDDCGAIILGMEEKRPNWDKIGKQILNDCEFWFDTCRIVSISVFGSLQYPIQTKGPI